MKAAVLFGRTLYTLLLCVATAASGAESARSWNFRVFLDRDPIGYHHFRLTPQGDTRELQSDTHFDVKFLFITAYHYDHHATEYWRGDCLTRLDSNSNDDGRILAVHALSDGHQLNVEAPAGRYAVTGCAMSFAYWDPVMLQQTRLINPETGEQVPVTIIRSGDEDIPVRGAIVHAQRYPLHAQLSAAAGPGALRAGMRTLHSSIRELGSTNQALLRERNAVT